MPKKYIHAYGKKMKYVKTYTEDKYGNWNNSDAQLHCDWGGAVIHAGKKHYLYMPFTRHRYYFESIKVLKNGKLGKRKKSKFFPTIESAKREAMKRQKTGKIDQAEFWDASNIWHYKAKALAIIYKKKRWLVR